MKLRKWSRELYRKAGQERGRDSGFREVGDYVVAFRSKEKPVFRRAVELRTGLSVPNDWLEPEDLARYLPYVDRS